MPTSSAPEHAPAGVLVLDKPEGLTSHDVVARVRRTLGLRRVGHAGTLDPMATGVLVVAVGRGTRLLPWLQATTKAYTATVRLGAATTTDDRTGEPLGPAVPVDLAGPDLDEAMARLIGSVEQRPSSVSAVQVGGRRAYARVRAGEQVELPLRTVQIDTFRRIGPGRPTLDGGLEFDCEIVCSTGTYVRAMARDLGAGLGCGGHLTALRRTAVGPFPAAEAVGPPARSEAATDRAAWLARLMPLSTAAGRVLPVAGLTRQEAAGAVRGQPVACGPRSGRHALLDPAGDLVAVARAEEGRWRWDAVFASP